MLTTQPVTRGGRRPGVWYRSIYRQMCRKQTNKTSLPLSVGKNVDVVSGLKQECVGRRGQLLAP